MLPTYSYTTIIYSILFFFGLLCLWEACVFCALHYKSSLPLILPAPSMIFAACKDQWSLIQTHAWHTFSFTFLSIVSAFLAAIPLGWSMASNVTVATIGQFAFVLLQSLPTFCLAPILVVWFGWGFIPCFVPAFIAAVIPLSISIFRGIRAQPKSGVEYFDLMNATACQKLFKLSLPSMMPSLFSGLRIAVSGSGMATVIGEWCGATKGLGIILIQTREQMNIPLMFACIGMICFISACMYSGVFFLEQLLLPHKRKKVKLLWRFLQKKIEAFHIKFIWIILTSLFLCHLMTSCSNGQSDENIQDEAGHTTLTPLHLILDWTPCPTHVPLYYGLKKNIFKDAGFDFRISYSHSLDPLQILSTNNDIDIVLSHLPRVIRLSLLDEFSLRVVGTIIANPLNGFLAKKECIHTIEEMQGKRVGFCGSKYSSSTLDALLSCRHITIGEKYNVRFDLLTQLVANNIDIVWGAFSCIEPYQLASLHITPQFFSVQNFGMPSYHELVAVASQKKSTFCNTATVQRFQKALQKALDMAAVDKDEAFMSYLSYHPEKGGKTQEWEKKAWYEIALQLSPCQTISIETIAKPLTCWLEKNHIIPQSATDLVSLLQFVDMQTKHNDI